VIIPDDVEQKINEMDNYSDRRCGNRHYFRLVHIKPAGKSE
jgi:hypothetical protein